LPLILIDIQMKITIWNDWKEKYQSFEAKRNDYIWYWQNEMDAISNLQDNINREIKHLQSIDYSNIYHAKAWNDISND